MLEFCLQGSSKQESPWLVIDLNVRHQTCLRSFCVEHSGQLPNAGKFTQGWADFELKGGKLMRIMGIGVKLPLHPVLHLVSSHTRLVNPDMVNVLFLRYNTATRMLFHFLLGA